MRHPIVSKVVAGSAAIACVSILSGCWWGRREPRHDDRVVVVHEERHEEHHEDHHEHEHEHEK